MPTGIRNWLKIRAFQTESANLLNITFVQYEPNESTSNAVGLIAVKSL